MNVFVLFAEYPNGESLAAVLSVHATREGADAAEREAVDRAHASNWQVWGDECPEDDPLASAWDEADWDVTFHVEGFEVQP